MENGKTRHAALAIMALRDSLALNHWVGRRRRPITGEACNIIQMLTTLFGTKMDQPIGSRRSSALMEPVVLRSIFRFTISYTVVLLFIISNTQLMGAPR